MGLRKHLTRKNFDKAVKTGKEVLNALPTINTNQLNSEFGKLTHKTSTIKRKKRSGNITITIRHVTGSSSKLKRKKDKGGYLDQLL